jgi:hypothetical protein
MQIAEGVRRDKKGGLDAGAVGNFLTFLAHIIQGMFLRII